MTPRTTHQAQRDGAVLVARGVSKTFGSKRVLNNASLELRPGEIHGLIGTNGSGKSTLVKILSGFHVPDPGAQLTMGGEEIRLPWGRGSSGGIDLQFVHQDLGLWDGGTVAENFSVVNHRVGFGWKINLREERERVRAALARFELDIPVDRLVGDLTAVERSLLAIVRAAEGMIDSDSGVLVLDEPTAALGRDSTEPLFALMRRLAAQGVALLFVSHRLDEIGEITDRITVLRDGDVVCVTDTASIDEEQLVEQLLGFKMQAFYPEPLQDDLGEVALSVSNLSGDTINAVSLEVRAGEVLGLAGMEGMGHEELPYLLFGAGDATAGTISVGGRDFAAKELEPRQAIDAGIALLPAHRIRDSGLLTATAEENLTLPGLLRRSALSKLAAEELTAEAHRHMEEFGVVPPDPSAELSTFSGGNQQKILLAKWFRMQPSVMVLHEPTQGVDVGAKRQIFQVINDAAKAGMAVVIASGEYEDLAHLCTRVMLFRDGEIAAELHGSALTYEEILSQCLVPTA